jgi:predicted RNA-binding protein (virulence factor B family)
MAILGKRNRLSIIRESTPGLYLDGGELGEILLPKRYIPPDIQPKQQMDVFVFRDSEDRLVATTETPLAEVGEFASLEVISVNPNVGAFLNWGLTKDLLLPFREQEKPVRVGRQVVVAVCLDEVSNRIYASARLKRYLSQEPPMYGPGQEVNLLIVSESPLGYSALVENAHLGMLFHTNMGAPLEIGQRTKGYIHMIHPSGKIDLRLDASGYKRVLPLRTQIVKRLEAEGGKLEFDDDSSPILIRAKFGVSKNAFKAALGALYKARRIRFTNPGIELVDNSNWRPGTLD